ncbi:Hypothetical protein PHPALM_9235 [Phytophthora palmivora]|uniref:PiggyBac transposable element-derived protein domain-containing protein n=1 Tax=Phytophthora palmivora TaxID=4796 RepID=A0A2P4Y7U0_9STRA|nr:Hypothetical protein PHPALM_9235 [Phytophthora palmivora]
MGERVESQHGKQKNSSFKPQERDQIRTELESIADITTQELCVFIGLLFARTVIPNNEKLENHWETTDEDERERTNKAWKLRPVCDALVRRFQHGYIPPATKEFMKPCCHPSSSEQALVPKFEFFVVIKTSKVTLT